MTVLSGGNMAVTAVRNPCPEGVAKRGFDIALTVAITQGDETIIDN
jgi:hypothetical protein